MAISRRNLLQLAGAAALAAPFAKAERASWRELLSLPHSECFGVLPGGRNRDPGSLYRFDTGGGAPLSFDVSNNQILCSLDAHGDLNRLCVNTAVLPLPANAISGGVYTAKLQVRGGPWKITIDGSPEGQPGDTEVSLLGGVVPEFRRRQGALEIRQVSFAPVDTEKPWDSPRAIYSALLLENQGSVDLSLRLQCDGLPGVESSGHARFVPLGEQAIILPAGGSGVLEAAVLLDSSQEGLDLAEKRVKGKAGTEWFAETSAWLAAGYGSLQLTKDPFAGEVAVRYAELCRQSFLRLPGGAFGGGFMGSDVDHRDNNWNKDTYYNVLGASDAHPLLCRDAIPFYFAHGLPAKPIARGLARFPSGAPVTQSLSLAVAPVVLAAHYYRLTGDRTFFERSSMFFERMSERLEEVLATRTGEPFLFPSMFISNGDSRGHYHTGSNVVAWFAFTGAARLATEVFGDEVAAARWRGVAERMRQSIWETCRKEGPLGPQFVEGVYEDGTYVPGHDGEETDTTLMPFYGFCPPDQPELIRHAKVGLSPLNPYYTRELDGIWWHNHGGFRPATAPAWATGLASAGSREELAARLLRFRELTDLDGSLWWWAYRYGEKDRRAVLRGNGSTKCGWAAAAYLLRFRGSVLGLEADAAARTLQVAPFLPGEGYRWQCAALGAACFDLAYEQREGMARVRIRNRNRESYRLSVRLSSLNSTSFAGLESTRPLAGEVRRRNFYELPAVEAELELPSSAEVEITAG